MPRHRLSLSIDPLDHAQLQEEAKREGLLPAALANRIVTEWLAQRSGASVPSDAVQALLQWLEPRIDEIRATGGWPGNVAISLFRAIEDDALDLYRAAEQQLGRNTLNQVVARHIRVRLGAKAVQRGGRVCVTRVPKGTTTLVKTVTLLDPPTP